MRTFDMAKKDKAKKEVKETAKKPAKKAKASKGGSDFGSYIKERPEVIGFGVAAALAVIFLIVGLMGAMGASSASKNADDLTAKVNEKTRTFNNARAPEDTEYVDPSVLQTAQRIALDGSSYALSRLPVEG